MIGREWMPTVYDSPMRWTVSEPIALRGSRIVSDFKSKGRERWISSNVNGMWLGRRRRYVAQRYGTSKLTRMRRQSGYVKRRRSWQRSNVMLSSPWILTCPRIRELPFQLIRILGRDRTCQALVLYL
jgi:hypothetical protein